jgi:hypothetical protein
MKSQLHSLTDLPEARDLAQLQTQMLRPAQNVNRDGGFELGLGTALICFGLGPYFTAALPKSVLASSWTGWICFLPIFCAALAPYAASRIIKTFFTWPRTGYVVNPYDMKFKQLLMLMGFGLAVGVSISMPLVLVFEIRDTINQRLGHSDLNTIIFHGVKLLVCAPLAVYLGRKVIRKPQPVPAAYEPALIKQGLSQTPAGRKRLRAVQFAMLAFFFGVPLLVCAAVFGLMYLNNSVAHRTEIHWSELGMPSLLVASNALLYFMGSGVVLKEHRWKWPVIPVMLAGPILVAPLIPYPAVPPGLIKIWEQLPPVMLFLGITWVLSGVATLILFIRNNPLPETAAE